MTALNRTALLAAIVALTTVGGCSKKESPAPAESAATTTPAAAETPAPAAPSAEPAPPSAEPAPAATEAPATAPPATETAAPSADAATVPAPAAEPAPSATPEAASASAAAPAATEAVAAATPAKPIDGGAIAQGICVACHGSGMNGAPKLGNKVAWTPRIAQGRETVYTHAIKGLRGMPARGGNPTLTDDEVKAAVDYMVKLAGGWKD